MGGMLSACQVSFEHVTLRRGTLCRSGEYIFAYFEGTHFLQSSCEQVGGCEGACWTKLSSQVVG
jgi:hypothetical protein